METMEHPVIEVPEAKKQDEKPQLTVREVVKNVTRYFRKPEKRKGMTVGEYAAKLGKQRGRYDLDAAVTAPKATVVDVESLTLVVPEAIPPRKDNSAQLEQARTSIAIDTTSEAFLMSVNAYLGLPAGSYSKPNFIEHVLATDGQKTAERGADIAGRTLHLQILRLIDRYRKLESGKFIETEYSDLTKTLNRLEGITNLYNDKSPGFVRLIQQRKYPSYDDTFLSLMGNCVNAFKKWDDGRPKEIHEYPIVLPDARNMTNAPDAAFRSDSSASFTNIAVPTAEPSSKYPIGHPDAKDMTNATNDDFRSNDVRFANIAVPVAVPSSEYPIIDHDARDMTNATDKDFRSDAKTTFGEVTVATAEPSSDYPVTHHDAKSMTNAPDNAFKFEVARFEDVAVPTSEQPPSRYPIAYPNAKDMTNAPDAAFMSEVAKFEGVIVPTSEEPPSKYPIIQPDARTMTNATDKDFMRPPDGENIDT